MAAKKPLRMMQTVEFLHTAASQHAGVDETIACKGTAVESASFKVGGKAFGSKDRPSSSAAVYRRGE